MIGYLIRKSLVKIQAPRLLSTLLIYCRRSEKPAIRLSEWARNKGKEQDKLRMMYGED